MEIAFSAERSIQDAIQELSQAESSTVLISYSVMFIYVSIALGKFRNFKTLLVRMAYVSAKSTFQLQYPI